MGASHTGGGPRAGHRRPAGRSPLQPSDPPSASGRLPSALAPWCSVGVLAGCLVFVFSRTMQRALDHDEHQFVASAVAWSRDGLLPYRDFPHFHMPYLVWLYGLGDLLTGRPYLVARLLSVAGAVATLGLVHGAVRRAVSRRMLWRASLSATLRRGRSCSAS